MPTWIYETPPLQTALIVVVFVEACSLAGLALARRFLVRRLRFSEGFNDAVSGTVQSIGVFYGITVGLIAVGVWNTNSHASDLVSREAASIGGLYRDVSGYPAPLRDELRAGLRNYTVYLIDEVWPAQKRGRVPTRGAFIIDDFESRLHAFEPATPGQAALHAETLRAFNHLYEYRRLRVDAVESGLSGVMWAVIWAGALISIGVAYFYKIEDPRLHTTLVALMSGFLAVVLLMIVFNDRPFYGHGGIPSDSYKLVLERVIDRIR